MIIILFSLPFLIGLLYLFPSLIRSYNRLVDLEQTVQKRQGDVQALILRRTELIQNLMSVVGSFGILEANVIGQVAKSKRELSPNYAAALNAISLVENYPQLKAAQNFLALQQQLERTEDMLAQARFRYNMAAKAFNTTIEQFPKVLVARLLRIRRKPYIAAEDTMRLAQIRRV
jgi:LemA protein